MSAERRSRRSRLSMLPLGAAAVAVVCCAGLPLLTAALGGLTVAAVLGISGGVIALIGAALFAVVLVRARDRRNCEPKGRR